MRDVLLPSEPISAELADAWGLLPTMTATYELPTVFKHTKYYRGQDHEQSVHSSTHYSQKSRSLAVSWSNGVAHLVSRAWGSPAMTLNLCTTLLRVAVFCHLVTSSHVAHGKGRCSIALFVQQGTGVCSTAAASTQSQPEPARSCTQSTATVDAERTSLASVGHVRLVACLPTDDGFSHCRRGFLVRCPPPTSRRRTGIARQVS